jgi:uncharacterized membrane protein
MTNPSPDIEQRIGRVLTTGTRLSSLLLAVGLMMSVGWPSSRIGARCLTVGLFVLLATPITRVIVSIVEFARQHDWWFVVFTAIVLGLLLGSVFAA